MPDVYVDNMTPDQMIAVYDWVMSQCRASEADIVWHIKERKDVPVVAVRDVARAYVAGEIESFRHGLFGLSIDGVELPHLTVCTEGPGGLSFDYEKGPDWNEQTIDALLELLARIREMVPQAHIWHAEEGYSDRPTPHFTAALLQFEIERG